MFTGIVEEVGILSSVLTQPKGINFTIACSIIPQGLKVGDSVAVNGICLTVTNFSPHSITATAMPVTLEKTTALNWRVGAKLNLERALLIGGRLDGHLVQGHVDCVLLVREVIANGEETVITVILPEDYANFVVSQGSVAIDGVSLTISRLTMSSFSVSLVEHTQDTVNLRYLKPGKKVNVEFDIFGKYILQANRKRITESFLIENGF